MKNKKSRWIKGIIGLAIASGSLVSHANEEKTSLAGRFEISRFDVQGNTLLPEQEINQLLAPYAGQNQDFGSVQKAVEALELAYRNKGYSVVRVVLPEQELNHGVVHLQVIEAKLGKVSVSDNKFFDEANIKSSIPSLKEGESPNMFDVATEVKLANENPAKKNVVQLQSGQQEGTVDAVIKVTDEKPWTAAVALDNTGDLQTGRNRITAAYQHANIGGRDHVLSMQYSTSVSQPHNVTIAGAGYHIPFYSLGDSLDLYTSYSNVDSGTVDVSGFGFDVSGNGLVVGTRYNHNLAKKGDYESVLSPGLDYKAFRNNINLFDTPLGNDVTVHPLSLTYAGNWVKEKTAVNFIVSGIHNIPGGKHGSSEDFERARVNASPNYTLVRYSASIGHALPKDWQVRFAVTGQWTRDALVPGEQFGVGGANSVRGFLERELVNDEGRITNLELYTPNLCSDNLQCRVLGFYDTGYLSRNYALFGEDQQQSVGSVGLGFRVNLARQWSAQTDWAYVVDGADYTKSGSNRAHFRLIMTF